jgi:hypothetical protein
MGTSTTASRASGIRRPAIARRSGAAPRQAGRDARRVAAREPSAARRARCVLASANPRRAAPHPGAPLDVAWDFPGIARVGAPVGPSARGRRAG